MRARVSRRPGFLDSTLAKPLLARGDEVVCVDNFNDYYSPARKRHNIERALAQPGYTLVEADIRDDAAIDGAFTAYRPDKVAHMAAMGSISYSVRHPKLY